MLRRLFIVAFIVCTLVGSLGHAQVVSGKASLLPILEILDTARVSGSVVLWGSCTVSYPPDLPKLRVSATDRASALQALREVLADDPAMQITQDSDGTIRMIERGVPSDILNVKIRHVSFEGRGTSAQSDGMYTPNDALRGVLQAPEIVDFMRAHDIERPTGTEAVPGNLFGPWPPEYPHISGSLDDVTLSEALDRILKTFPGIWVYENCPGSKKKSRSVYFHFFYLRDIGHGVFVEG